MIVDMTMPPRRSVLRGLPKIEFALLTGRNSMRLAFSDPRFPPADEVEQRHRDRAIAILTEALAEIDRMRREP